ncbi:MAG: DsbA family protein [Solirubrobacteraceae bacterium]|nr:DsbA family protein [Solirubrobacteraceae bacterium]
MPAVAVFRYEFSSPYSYFAAHRVDELLPIPVRWEPILFGALAQSIDKVPWSLQPGEARDRRMRECERHAEALGLPLRWPRDWPLGTYSVLAARAAVVADEVGRQREFALQAFRLGLGLGRDLTDLTVVLEAAEAAQIAAEVIEEGVQRPEIKAQLRDATEAAVQAGVTGVPTVTLPGGEHFWGDDQLEVAAAAAQAYA